MIQKILWWTAGVDAEILNNCKSKKEKLKYSAFGFSILLTTACAVLSGGYAFYTICKNPTHALLLGLFWGLFVFNMDRLIIITTHKESQFSWRQLGMAITRILVALLIAVVVAIPLELKLFEKPILAQLAQDNAKIAIEVKQSLNQGTPEIQQLEADIQQLEKTISDKESKRDLLCNKSIEEAEGESGTGKVGKGPVYLEKLQICLNQNEELKKLRHQTEPILAQKRSRITQLQVAKDEQLKTVTTARERADDLVTQLNVLEKISKNNPAIAHASHAISLLFIVIDTAPIFAKLLAKRGPYDARLEQVEHEEVLRADEERENFKVQLTQELTKEKEFYTETLEKAYKNEENEKITTVQQELIEEITNRTRKKYIPKKKVNPFGFFFSS